MEKNYVITMLLNKKDYVKCNMYYLLRFLGLPELIVFLAFIAMCLAIFFIYANALPLAFAGGVVVLLIIAVLIAYGTTVSGYNIEFLQRKIAYQKLYLDAEKLRVESFLEGHEQLQEEEFLVTRIEKIAIHKNSVYIYPMSAICYYIKAEYLEGANFEEFKAFLKETFPPATFKMRKKIKMYPKNAITK